jgi:hypothetical protein
MPVRRSQTGRKAANFGKLIRNLVEMMERMNGFEPL